MATLFKILGDPTRLRIIRYIASHEDRLCVAEIAGKVGVTISAVSQHMRVLRQAGIAGFEKRGNQVYYHIQEDALSSFAADVERLMALVRVPCNLPCRGEACPRKEMGHD